MKIRMDFVTNSSSASYVVTFDKRAAEEFNHFDESDPEEEKKKQIFDAVRKDLLQNGVKSEVDGHDFYTRVYQINNKKKLLTDDSFSKPIEEVDFSSFSDEELWQYIKGEYLLKSRLAEEFKAVGEMIVPHQKPDITRVLVIKEETFDQFVTNRHGESDEQKIRCIARLVTEDIKKTGTHIKVADQDVYLKVYEFNRRTDTDYDNADLPDEEIDYEAMEPQKLWRYIRGEYIEKGRIGSEVRGFRTLPAPRADKVVPK